MKILSKYKDYYDYLTGIYGIDEKKVLDRTSYVKSYISDEFTLIFCGKPYKCLPVTKYESDIKNKKFWSLPRDYRDFIICKIIDGKVWMTRKNEIKIDTKIPIIVVSLGENINYQPLKSIGFDKVLSPQEAYLAIEAFISYTEPDVKIDPTDMQQFEGKGFDKKTSFRKL